MIKCSNVYKVQSDCRIKLERSPYIEGVIHRGDLITILEIILHVGHIKAELAYVIINETFFYIKLEELSNLIEEGFLSLENQTMVTSNIPKTLSDDDIMKYRLKALFREWISKLNGLDIECLLKLSRVSPERFGVDNFNKIYWANPAYAEIAVDVLFEKIEQLP